MATQVLLATLSIPLSEKRGVDALFKQFEVG